MTQEKILSRVSSAWYISAALIAAMIVADMVLHGVTSLNIPPALLSMVFAYVMFSGNRVEDRVIARYQTRPPSVGRATTTAFATRFDVLRLLGNSLWASWVVLLASYLAFSLVGDLNLSRALTEGMIALVLVTIPLRVFIAAALFR